MEPSPRNSRTKTAIACAILLAVFASLSWTAVSRTCATCDEGYHLVSAWLALGWRDYPCDPEDPPLWKYWAVVGAARPEINLKSPEAMTEMVFPKGNSTFVNDVLYAPGNDVDALLRATRARMLVLGVLLGAVVAFWSWQLGGGAAAVISTLFYCFDPNFMAHAPLVKNDVPISLAILIVAYLAWRCGRRIAWLNCVGSGVALGVALSTKFSGVLVVPMFAAMLLARAMLGQPWPTMAGTLMTRARRFLAAITVIAIALLIAWGVIWICYAGRFAPSSMPADFNVKSEIEIIQAKTRSVAQSTDDVLVPMQIVPLDARTADWKFRVILFVDRHQLLPQSWIAGFLFTYEHSMARQTFLLGQRGLFGWWYYFPLAMAFKTPLATLAAAALVAAVAALAAWRGGKRLPSADPARSWAILCVAVPPIFYLVSAMSAHLNLGLRHVLPIYPYLYIAIGLAGARAWRLSPRATTVLATIFALSLGVENLQAFPNYIAFFNVAAGGSRGGLALLSDSNLDWGQNLPQLAEWQRANPDCDLLLCYFGAADPRYYGIQYINLPGSNAPPDLTIPTHKRAVMAISATNLQGAYLVQQQQKMYEGFRGRQPLAVLGGTIYLFEVSPQ